MLEQQQQTNKLNIHNKKGVFLGIPETNVGSLLCCGSYSLSFQSFLIRHLIINQHRMYQQTTVLQL